jgi:putative hydrolase of the HAD superfamily
MIKAIGFDIDGTLYPANALFGRMLGGALMRLPLLLAFSKVRKEIRQPAFYESSGLAAPADIEAFHRMQSTLTAAHLGQDVDQVHTAIEAFFYARQEEHFDRIKLFPECRPVLESLRALALPLGALSDFPATRKLQNMRLDQLFDVIMTSEETGYVKPHSRPFDCLAERLGVHNEEVLYVGNSEHYDVQGARLAGMKTALISHTKTRHSEADFVFSHYRQLFNYVKSLL